MRNERFARVASKRIGFIAIGHHGTIHQLNQPTAPLKQLLEKCGRKHSQPIYCDPNARHVGWVVAQEWFDVYELFPLHTK